MPEQSTIPDVEDNDVDFTALPPPKRKQTSAAAARTASIDSRLQSLKPGKARKFPFDDGETIRGMKLRLSKRVTQLKLSDVVTIESAMFDGVEIVYARFKPGVTGYPAETSTEAPAANAPDETPAANAPDETPAAPTPPTRGARRS